MRVLILTQVVVYPADAGPKVKTLQVLRQLAAQHDAIYCTFVRSEQEQRHAQALRALCRRVETVPLQRSRLNDLRFLAESLLSGDSFLLRRDEHAAMHDLVRRVLAEERIEVLHVDQLNMMRFVPPHWHGRVVLDEHNAVWQVVRRLQKGTKNPLKSWLLDREARLIASYEGNACRRADVVLTVSDHDQHALRRVAGSAPWMHTIPITVDAQALATIASQRGPQPDRLLSVGTMFWPPNSEGIAWWLEHGYEQLRALCPSVTYDIVGARPPASLVALAERHAGVRLHGYVADVAPFWKSAGALAVPLLSGGGVRVKILEAMAMGVPVVSTTVGCEGLDVRDGEHLLVADGVEAFAYACERLLRDSDLARRLAANARRLVLERYDARVALRDLEDVYARLARKAMQPVS